MRQAYRVTLTVGLFSRRGALSGDTRIADCVRGLPGDDIVGGTQPIKVAWKKRKKGCAKQPVQRKRMVVTGDTAPCRTGVEQFPGDIVYASGWKAISMLVVKVKNIGSSTKKDPTLSVYNSGFIPCDSHGGPPSPCIIATVASPNRVMHPSNTDPTSLLLLVVICSVSSTRRKHSRPMRLLDDIIIVLCFLRICFIAFKSDSVCSFVSLAGSGSQTG